MACITENSHGRGRVYYIGGGVDEGTLNLLAENVLWEQEIGFIERIDGVEIYPRTTKDGIFYFLMNHTGEEKQLKGVTLKPYEGRIVNTADFSI